MDARSLFGCENQMLAFGTVGIRLRHFNMEVESATVDAVVLKHMYSANSTVPLKDLREHHADVSLHLQKEVEVTKGEIGELHAIRHEERTGLLVKDTTIGLVLVLTCVATLVLVTLEVVGVKRGKPSRASDDEA